MGPFETSFNLLDSVKLKYGITVYFNRKNAVFVQLLFGILLLSFIH